MNHNYQVNDFINPQYEPISIVIDKKISLLYDFEILKGTKSYLRNDPRENAVREWLKQYDTEYKMNRVLRDILTDKTDLNSALTQKVVM